MSFCGYFCVLVWQQLLDYAVHCDGLCDDETGETWFISTQASAQKSQEVFPM